MQRLNPETIPARRPPPAGRNDRNGLFVALLMMMFVGIVLARFPAIIAQGGRFWAEEGTIYFRNTQLEPWYDAWFTIIPREHAPYLNLTAGFSTWLGVTIMGLRHAPLVTTAMALLVQSLPPLIILTHRFPWIKGGGRENWGYSIAAVLICAMAPVAGEVWVNTIESQMHLVLAASLILAAPVETGSIGVIDLGCLLLAVLSGPGTSILLPLFALRAMTDRTRRRWFQAGIVLLGFAIQLTLYMIHPASTRAFSLNVIQLLTITSLHTVILPFGGIAGDHRLSGAIAQLPGSSWGVWLAMALFVAFYGMVGMISLIWRDLSLAALGLASGLFGLVAFAGALTPSYRAMLRVGFDGRYAFAPDVLNGLIVVYLAARVTGWPRWVIRAGLLSLLINWGWTYRTDGALFAHGPEWSAQIAAWEQNPTKSIGVWPNGWRVIIPGGRCRIRDQPPTERP